MQIWVSAYSISGPVKSNITASLHRKRGNNASIRAKLTKFGTKADALPSLPLAEVGAQQNKTRSYSAKRNQRLLCPHLSGNVATSPTFQIRFALDGQMKFRTQDSSQ